MTLRKRDDRPDGYPTALALFALGVAILAVGTPPASLILGALGCLTGLVAGHDRYHRGGPR